MSYLLNCLFVLLLAMNSLLIDKEIQRTTKEAKESRK